MLTQCSFRQAADLPGVKSMFKNHLIAHSLSYYPINSISHISYVDEAGCYYAAIFKQNKSQLRIVVVHIDDSADLINIEQFMRHVLQRFTMLSHEVEFIDQSAHAEYTTGKVSRVLEAGYTKWDYRGVPEHYHCTESDLVPAKYGDRECLREGYSVKRLGVEHVEQIINVHYPSFKLQDSRVRADLVSAMRECMEYRPSYGVFVTETNCCKDEVLVACCTIYDDCALGAVHVLQGYRRMGLARVLVRHFMTRALSQGFTGVCNIASDNRGSKRLFQGEGFVRQEICPMSLYFKKVEVDFAILGS